MLRLFIKIICSSTVFLVSCGGSGDTKKPPDTNSPVFVSKESVEVFENQSNAIVLQSEDESRVTYSIRGEDSAMFDIKSSSGTVWFKKLPDYESKSIYEFEAVATDASGNKSTQNITIQIKDVENEYSYKQTGQIQSYNEKGDIDKTLKDDGFYQKGIKAEYVRNADIVTDKITHLKWYDPDDSTSHMSWNDAKQYCKNLQINGKNWRLASANEMMTIVNRNKINPAVNGEFNHMQPKDYWSSTEFAGRSTEALFVNFQFGYDGNFSKTKVSPYVRCVNGPSPKPPSFSRNNILEIVTDIHTRLQWQDNKHVIDEKKSWIDAIEYCENLKLDGKNWRLPNINELYHLADRSRFKPSINNRFKYKDNKNYWSATSSTEKRDEAWSVYFLNGQNNIEKKTKKQSVRCVRDGE